MTVLAKAKSQLENVSEDDDVRSDVLSEPETLSNYDHSVEESKVSVKSGRGGSGRSRDENWQNSTWQYTVLVPLADQLKSTHNQDKLSVIKGFEKIIQTCGQ